MWPFLFKNSESPFCIFLEQSYMSSKYIGYYVFGFIALIIGIVAYWLYHESISNNHHLLVMGKLESGTAIVQNCDRIYQKGRIRGQQIPDYHIILEGVDNAPNIHIETSKVYPPKYPYYDLSELYFLLREYQRSEPIPIQWKKNSLYRGHDVIASVTGLLKWRVACLCFFTNQGAKFGT